MNEKFFRLSQEKQQRIINAGYRIFAENSYKKSPVGEIAAEAGISKSLLFHYFQNKRELYLFLWKNMAEMTQQAMVEFHCHEKTDLFEMLEAGLQAKMWLMRRFPDMALFALRAFFEKDPQIEPFIQQSYRTVASATSTTALEKQNPEDFIPGIDLKMMYREMYWAAEGYMLELMRQGPVNFDRLEQDFKEMIHFWRRIYKRKEEDSYECN